MCQRYPFYIFKSRNHSYWTKYQLSFWIFDFWSCKITVLCQWLLSFLNFVNFLQIFFLDIREKLWKIGFAIRAWFAPGRPKGYFYRNHRSPAVTFSRCSEPNYLTSSRSQIVQKTKKMKILKRQINPQAPVAQKIADEVVFRHF